MDYQNQQAQSEEAGSDVQEPQFRDFKSQNPVKPVKVRRVGTMTLGISLVATGALLLLNLFMKDFPLYQVAKLSPIILVLVGIEIVVATLFNKGEKLRYDFFSMFICFFLIFGSIGLSILPQFVENALVMDQMENRFSSQIEKDVYNAVQEEGIQEMYVGFYFFENMHPFTEPMNPDLTYQEVDGAYLSLDLTLSQEYTSAEDFAKSVRNILDKVEPLQLPDPSYYIRDKEGFYSISLHDLWEYDYTVEQLTDLIDGSSY
ncbi:MAG: hypothetical protein ACOX6P_00785 [Candidatus Merdivicinus sp.]|jgi:hypothetical protein